MTRKKIINTGILAIIPFIYLFAGFHFNHLIGLFSLRDIDPEYIYFISGLGIADGHLHIGHIDNPGTPLQYLVALTFRLAYALSSHQHPFNEDVFLNSDYYLALVNHVILVAVTVCLYFVGKKVFEKTQNIGYALLIQTAPFYSEITYDIIGRVVPELLIPIPVILLSLYFLKSIFSENKEFRMKDVVLLALISGFGLSIKLNFIALWIIPLFILPGIRKKILFAGFSIVAFFLIALPVALEINTFYVWVKNLIIHTGEYGQGDASFINWSTFTGNIKTIWGSTHNLFYLLILIIFSSAIFFFRKKTASDNILFRTSVGITVAIILQIALVSKHYSYHYLIPSLAFVPMLIVLPIEMVSRMYPTKWNKKLILAIVIFGFIPGVNKQLTSAQIRTTGIGEEMDAKRETWHVASSLEKNSIKIIVSQNYGSPFREYALLYSTAWAANSLKPSYYQELIKLFPNTYQFTTWDDKFQHWGDEFNPEEIQQKGLPVYIYLERNADELYNRTIAKLDPEHHYVFARTAVFINSANKEAIYQLSSSVKSTNQ